MLSEGRGAADDDAALLRAALRRFELVGSASAVWAALDAGVLARLVESAPRTASDLAAELDLDDRILERVLELVTSTDLVRVASEARGDGGERRYAPGPALAALRRHGPAFADLELSVWRRVPGHLARRSQVADAPPDEEEEEAGTYAAIADDLSRLAEPAARRLAAERDLSGVRRVLDVGCGAGVWSLALARAHPAMEVTGLDRPPVVKRFLERARRMGLADRAGGWPGDMHAVRLPAGRFDLAIVANVLRLEPPERADGLVRRVARSVAPGGALLVVDALGGRGERGRRLQAAYRLHLALRNPRGEPPDPERLAALLRSCGFGAVERVDLGTDGPLGILLARGRSPAPPEAAPGP